MKRFFLAVTVLSMTLSLSAREHWGPPPLCPQPKADCCPKPCKPKRKPKSYNPAPCKPKACKPKPCATPCQTSCDPCCPPVCLTRGYPDTECCLPSAYSEPANIDLRCGADLFITASFTYWQAIQGGMDLAVPGQATGVSPLAGITQPALNQSVLIQDFDYQPGFQIGLGWSGGSDGWVYYGEYTWYRGTTHTSVAAPANNVGTINGVAVGSLGVWLPTSWLRGVYQNSATTTIASQWDCNLDIGDLQISRPFYSGKRLILEPLFGLRGLWIRQALDLTATVLPDGVITPTASPRTAQYRSHSWAVGPRAGLNGKWHMAYGLRLIGDMSASVLYTQYTEVTQDVGSPDAAVLPLRVKLDNFDALRPNLDLSIGLGWGSYFACRRVHFDLAATYDFNIFWEQNMMRYLADLTADATSRPDGAASNLFLQGLTVKADFEF